jgi:hypothetical protein
MNNLKEPNRVLVRRGKINARVTRAEFMQNPVKIPSHNAPEKRKTYERRRRGNRECAKVERREERCKR